MKRVLDMCCGGRMMWFDRSEPLALFGDRRRETVTVCDRSHGRVDGMRKITVAPDALLDFRCLPFADETFDLVVWDPPHLRRAGPRSWLAAKYGKLGDDWRADLAAGFREGFRVLRVGGSLIFKWSEVHVPLREVLALTSERPLFGNTSGRKAGTHWIVYLKNAVPPPRAKEGDHA